ncbi:hypothetical protein ACIQ7Q_13155 [Streptomyces sp. NPDC096176]
MERVEALGVAPGDLGPCTSTAKASASFAVLPEGEAVGEGARKLVK